MIDEKKLIEKLEKANQGVCHYCGCDLDSEIVEEIVNELAEEHNGDWIPVSERLPEINKPVLCWVRSTTIASGETYIIGSCSSGFWFLQTYEIGHHHFPVKDYEVVAWQPLPEPYRQEEEKDAMQYGITVEEAGGALEKLSEAIRKATTADSIELEKRNIERNPSINFFQKRKLIKQLDEMKGEL